MSLTYYSGFYNLLRSLMINTAAMQLFPYCQGIQIDDKKAKVTHLWSMKPEYFIRVLNIGAASLEALYLENSRYLINVFFGLLGNMTSITLFRHFFSDLQNSNDPESVLMLYFIAQIGFEMGSGLAYLGGEAYSYCSSKLAFRESLKQSIEDSLQKSGSQAIEITFQEKAYSPGFWWRRSESIKLHWVGQNSTSYATECLIQPDQSFISGSISCNAPQIGYKAIN